MHTHANTDILFSA